MKNLSIWEAGFILGRNMELGKHRCVPKCSKGAKGSKELNGAQKAMKIKWAKMRLLKMFRLKRARWGPKGSFKILLLNFL